MSLTVTQADLDRVRSAILHCKVDPEFRPHLEERIRNSLDLPMGFDKSLIIVTVNHETDDLTLVKIEYVDAALQVHSWWAQVTDQDYQQVRRHTCPRRATGYQPHKVMADIWELDDTCSYCGSYHPDALLEQIEQKRWGIVPTDKSYKAYVGPITSKARGEAHYADLAVRFTPVYADHSRSKEALWTHVNDQKKFYFQHFDQNQQLRFIDLWNKGQLQIGCPGHFYVTPFFIKLVTTPVAFP